MNLQHAVSLARLHTNKPAGTCGLTPTPASFAFVDVGNALTIFASTQSSCAQTKAMEPLKFNVNCFAILQVITKMSEMMIQVLNIHCL